ncbi:conserved membrane protein of unknown function [Paenibacillus alvei]|uniref:Glycosyltransferase RgtA/B/C/D-like domain-containing protein n=2 Tax=Paenibacillus alvei TaxID=44250 RepID=A0A383R3Y7_PAEAL|nr:conserved membrane protein of unknown function [Paenibacillus alvei]
MEMSLRKARICKIPLLFILLSFLCIILFYMCGVFMGYSPDMLIQVPFIMAGYTAFVFILAYLAYRHLQEERAFILFIACLAFCIRFMWVLVVDTKPVSDFHIMYDAAVKMSVGDFSYKYSDYFQAWTYQLGFTMYQALMIKIFGTSLLPLKIINALCCAGITVLVYKIGRNLFHEFAAKFASITYCFFIPSIVMSSVLTNQHLATFLFYLGFYFLLQKRIPNWRVSIAIAVVLSLGNLIRPLGIVILLSILFYAVIYLIVLKKESIKKVIGFLVIFMTTYFAVFYLVSFIAVGTGISNTPLENHDPMWKFVLGFNRETEGAYSEEDFKTVSQYPLGEERTRIEKEMVWERLSNVGELSNLFLSKIRLMWGEVDALFWSLNTNSVSSLFGLIHTYSYVSYFVIILLLFLAVDLLILRRDTEHKYLFLILLILGYMGVHLFIEVQQRYRYFIMPSMIIIEGYGAYALVVVMSKWKERIPFRRLLQLRAKDARQEVAEEA